VEGHDVNGNTDEEHVYPPLAFTFGWSVGMIALLDAGADPFCALILALRYKDDLALSLLLEYDCALFSSSQAISKKEPYRRLNSYNSILSFALGLYEASDKAKTLIASRLVSHRRRLVNLAAVMLSSTERQNACMEAMSDRRLPDRFAKPVVLALRKKGIMVPDVLWPGDGQCSIYHDLNMTLRIAEQLYSGGFQLVDDMDETGVTPLQIACMTAGIYKERWELISWYLDKGAMPYFRNPNQPKTCYLAITSSLSNERITDIKKSAESVIRRILGRTYDLCGPEIVDSCICYCSAYGCTPVQLLHKRYGGDWSWTSAKFNHWAYLNDLTLMQKESCGEELCRLEIFERIGMAHTCCEFKHNPCAYGERLMPSDEDCHELREEDKYFSQALELYMCIYRYLRREHFGPFSNFWCSWWTTINEILPEKAWISHKLGGHDYVPNIDEIRSSVQSELRNYNLEDYEDVFLDSISMFS
jgi:hypothetical protein